VSVLAPPPHDDPELLIREARARQRKRWLGAAFAVALLAGAALAIDSIAAGGSPSASSAGGPTVAVKTGRACGIRVDDMRIVGSGGRTLYREPGNWTRGYPHPSVVRCSGSTVWVVWDNGAASNQEGYVGARSADGGRSWKLVFAESYFGVNAPHELDSYLGPWTVRSPQVAYFVGWCPACSPRPTVSVWVTRNAGGRFAEYPVRALFGYEPETLRASGNRLTISGRAAVSGLEPHRAATVRIP
jgi:hypothetical protein